ncbi:MAG: EAL domain-containing protein [Spirochaetales bacterium]|nr:EAL domain-containing protein [Spirochaetales bacterium]
MEKPKISILLIDDDEDEYIIVKDLFAEISNNYEIHWVSSFDTGLKEIMKDDYDVCLLDFRLGPHTGIDLLKEAAVNSCTMPIVFLTGQGDRETDITAMKTGASDYLDKGRMDANTLERTVRYCLERKKAAERIKSLAYYDQLTLLPNRTLFLDRLKLAFLTARRYNRMLSLLYLDIDNFKRINDSLGHIAGDELIKEVAERLMKYIRISDSICRTETDTAINTIARMGGDEFTIILSEIKEIENASRVADRILHLLSSPMVINSISINVTVSIGISIFPLDADTIDTLIKNADLAMYNAKALGKNNFQYFNPEMNASAVKRLILESEIQEALQNDHFILYYQPIINVKTKKIVIIEALVRWIHPEKGLISPRDFISLAEENGLILPLSDVIFQIVGKFYDKTGRNYPDIKMAVNISPKQLNDVHFIESVEMILKQYLLPPGYLIFEITENCIISDMKKTITLVHKLKQLGIQISMDDFGAGYTSFNHLKQIPFDYIKIHHSYIATIPENPGDNAITSGIINIGQSFNLKVIAEGVETESQVKFLESKKCDMIQGFYFYHPMPEDKLNEVLKSKEE